ncbi:hypothetical protein [Pseudoglutamicibacter cumminsii]|uniref:LXG domain-containing protein n=1 Tax=Pseudoglutamicibacter cumminsii TaxID=156979 RepID=A0ABX5LBF3_9MICC|nr:hypothetical protein [Pseudoglutamicibacter cumminsii]PWI28600.1 hypothetical protein CAY35_00570 [Pseudoglutamicibacter cumminsii]
MSFDVVDLDQSSSASAAGSDIRSAGEAIVGAMNSVQGRWSPIGGQYIAPESGQVVTAMETPTMTSVQIDEATQRVKSALDSYASALNTLNQQRERILSKIAQYDAMNPPPDDVDAQMEKERLRKEIESDCQQLAQDKDSAQNACQGQLLGISVAGHSASMADGVDLAKANEAGGKVVGSFFKTLWDKAARNNSFDGAPGVLLQASLLFMDKWKYTAQGFLMSGRWTTLASGDTAWKLPTTFQYLADKGGVGLALIHKFSGWQHGATPQSWNPMAKPTTFKEGVKAFAGRSLLKLDGASNRVALNAVDKPFIDGLSKASKTISRVGTGVSFVTTSVSSWQADSKTYPGMGNGEKAARAGVRATTSTVGGWAGAKTGAATGAALGSFVGPVGTAVGAVAGGLIGGVVGGKAGGWVGDKIIQGAEYVAH